jgi:hypothetical protein
MELTPEINLVFSLSQFIMLLHNWARDDHLIFIVPSRDAKGRVGKKATPFTERPYILLKQVDYYFNFAITVFPPNVI